MKIIVRGLSSTYEAEHLARVFFPSARICAETKHHKQDVILVRVNKANILCGVRYGNKLQYAKIMAPALHNGGDKDFEIATHLYKLLCEFTGQKPVWGLLTGVRPVRIVHDMWAKGKTDAEVENTFANSFYVNQDKIDLAMRTAHVQEPVMRLNTARSYSLYISIPFCPSRCSYCSFVSRSVDKSMALIPAYLAALEKEIAAISQLAKRNALKLETIYIGGGTPTSISAEQLAHLMQTVRECFDIGKLREYTVEAGRPDCTTAEKLDIIKKYGATRISINPQTLNDEVLAAIGRKHSAKDIIDCFNTARRLGHDNINMDLIAGLPKDTLPSFKESLAGVMSLRPENITVHTLTLKRASNIVIENQNEVYADVAAMINSCQGLATSGYEPYYLYRQKNTLQSLENTGYCLNGKEGLYNIFIMEEVHSILSAGAGGSTKLCAPSGRIERIFNYKYPHEYLSRFDTVIERKKGVDEFYAGYMDT
ncbi:MAG: coproporphyrinogen dehydrogenase HemZ [Oscillospiraceae bacterium]